MHCGLVPVALKYLLHNALTAFLCRSLGALGFEIMLLDCRKIEAETLESLGNTRDSIEQQNLTFLLLIVHQSFVTMVPSSTSDELYQAQFRLNSIAKTFAFHEFVQGSSKKVSTSGVNLTTDLG